MTFVCCSSAQLAPPDSPPVRSLPSDVTAYKRTPEFTQSTVPQGLKRRHNTKAGVWGRIRVVEGELIYRILEPEIEEHRLSPGVDGIVEPRVDHQVATIGPVRFFVEFLGSAS